MNCPFALSGRIGKGEGCPASFGTSTIEMCSRVQPGRQTEGRNSEKAFSFLDKSQRPAGAAVQFITAVLCGVADRMQYLDLMPAGVTHMRPAAGGRVAVLRSGQQVGTWLLLLGCAI